MITRRREILIALGAAALAAPFDSFAQSQGKVWRVGILSGNSRLDSNNSNNLSEFSRGMRELGYVEGKNLAIEWRVADGKAERLPGLAVELAALNVDVILAAGSNAVGAAQKATATIPIVMGSVIDPVGSGFIKSLAHPGGNITGLSNLAGDLGPKHLEMLRAMVPKLSRVAVLVNPANRAHALILKSIQSAAQKSNVNILSVQAQSPQEIETSFTLMNKEKAGAVIVVSDPIFSSHVRTIAALAAKHRLPSISSFRSYAEAGVLITYGANFGDLYRRAATYVDKIFKGAKPGDLPVEQPTIFELYINGKTAKALRLKIPQSLLISADKVIE